MQLSNQLYLMYETDSVDTQAQILTVNSLLAQDSCAPFDVKLLKRSPARLTQCSSNLFGMPPPFQLKKNIIAPPLRKIYLLKVHKQKYVVFFITF